MMMTRIITTAILLAAGLNQSAFSASGLLFNVTANGTVLAIKSTVPNHIYPAAGIKINTPGVTFASTSPGCVMAANGYCLFSVSDQTAANITTTGISGPVAFRLCLNGAAPLSCQNYSRTLTGPLVTVGSYRTSSGAYVPTSYTSTNGGNTWALSNGGVSPLLSPPADSLVNSTALSRLYMTTCDLTGQRCFAIGDYTMGVSPGYTVSNGSAPLGYTSANGGHTWALAYATLPADVLKGTGAFSRLFSITCDPTGQSCSTVGYYTRGVAPGYTVSNGTAPLSYTSVNGGQTWTLVNMPLPADALIGGASGRSQLNNATCDPTGQNCSAVGFYARGVAPGYTVSNGTAPLSYTSTNGGQTWTLSSTLPLPADVRTGSNAFSTLNRTSCDLTGLLCTAAGTYRRGVTSSTTVSNGIAPLSYTSTNGGQSWVLSTSYLPLPADGLTGANAISTINYLLCDATGLHCTATGYYTKGLSPSYTVSNGTAPLSYTSANAGRTWAFVNMPLPADALTGAQAVSRVSSTTCDPTGQNCSAVGFYTRGVAAGYTVLNGSAPLGYTSANGGQTWALSNQGSSLPLPANAALDSTSLNTQLTSVYCGLTGLQCVAVGIYNYLLSKNYDDLPLSYASTDGGKTWGLSDTLPLASDSDSIPDSGLLGVH